MMKALNDNYGIAARCGWQALPREENQNSDSEDGRGPGKANEKEEEAKNAYIEQRLKDWAAFEWRYGNKKLGS